jgi:hypothetical protein
MRPLAQRRTLELSPNSPDYDAMPARYGAQAMAARKAVQAAKPPKQLDDFDYGEDYFAKTGSNAHILRANPRFSPEGADIASAHRVMRRAIPYGPQYKLGEPVTVDRGLIGPFIGLDLADQFEFIMGAWFLNGAAFTAPAQASGGACGLTDAAASARMEHLAGPCD